MKNRNLVVGVAVAAVIIVVALVFVVKPFLARKAPQPADQKAAKTIPAAAGKSAQPVKKPVIAKDMGGLNVKLLNSKGKEVSVKVRAFKKVDGKSGIYVCSFMTNRMKELVPGVYDIEVETMPSRIYRSIDVLKDRETIEDLGPVTGSFEIKGLGSNKQPARYPVRLLHAKTNSLAAATATNRPIEIVAGVYDVEIGSAPRQIKKDVRIDAGKETVIDIGSAGSIIVKVADETGKAMRRTVRVRQSDGGRIVATGVSNRAFDVMPGIYTIEVASRPVQTKSDVKIAAGEEVVVDMLAPAKPAAQVPAQVKK